MMQLFCIPYAGGNAYSFLGLTKHTDDWLQVHPLETPGRGRRGQEPLLETIPELTEDLLKQIRSRVNGPYALYGHSLGAYLANLVIRRLLEERHAPPCHLFVSGAAGPTRLKPERLIHRLPKDEFLSEVGKYGGLPKEVLALQELIDYFEPILRADFTAIENDRYPGLPPLDLDITVMTGVRDSLVTMELVRLWQAETRRPLTIEPYPGDHFFIFEQWPRIGERICNTLRPYPAG
ncbi:MAG: thioesterase [Magnetococcales bacterium]|nr:thioesterase [Magnetococcales bacterium]